ncbi:MAG: hypothetical protein AB7K37_14060 [Cyclobacteriaceae bacterium]
MLINYLKVTLRNLLKNRVSVSFGKTEARPSSTCSVCLWGFTSVIIIFLAVVAMTVGAKSYKAAAANPVDTLRDE